MTAVEDRLTRALEARAALVRPEHLAPTARPAEAPHGRGALLVLAVAAVAVVVGVVGVVVVLGGDDEPGPTTPPVATDPPTSSASADRRPPPLWPPDDPRSVGLGAVARFPDGSTGVLGRTDLTLESADSGQGVSLPDYAGAVGTLAQLQVRFDDGVVGYLVTHRSGDYTSIDVVLDTGDGLVLATPSLDSVPFGASPSGLYDTWTAGDGAGLYTRVAIDTERQRFQVYRWAAEEQGSGVALVPRPVGRYCRTPGVAGLIGPC